MRRYIPSIIFIIFLLALSVGSTIYTEPGKIGKDIIFDRVYTDFPVTFSHKNHVQDYEQTCSACHTQIFGIVASDLKIMMTDFKKGTVCGACHLGGKAFGPPDNCTLCHDVNTKEAIDYQGYLGFYHDSHVKEYGFECDVCHDSLFKTEISEPHMSSDELQEHLDQGRLCGACHNGLKAFPHYVF